MLGDLLPIEEQATETGLRRCWHGSQTWREMLARVFVEECGDALAHHWPCPKQTNNGGHGCMMWHEGCKSGSKQERGRFGRLRRGAQVE